MNFSKIALIACSVLTAAGCSSFGIDGPFLNSRTLKADERMLLVTREGVRKGTGGDGLPGAGAGHRVVCAEPSPDAMMAWAASGSLKGGSGAESVAAAAAFSQTLGELGERTPVIQMLRDSLFRACEAYMNGLLNDDQYNDILVFFDIYSITLLGIESLTHSPRQPVIIQTAANAKTVPGSNPDTNGQDHKSPPSGSTEADAEGLPPAPREKTDSKDHAAVASQISEILKEYYKAKAVLFYLSEAKKLNGLGKGPLNTPTYIKMMEKLISSSNESSKR